MIGDLILFFVYTASWAAFLTGSVALAASIQTWLDKRKDRQK